jgi:hypothetical protein
MHAGLITAKASRRLRQGCQMVSFSDQKSKFGYILEDLGMENVGIFSVHLEYFTTIGYILWSLVNFKSFGILYQEKSGNPGLSQKKAKQKRQCLTQ